ncbi:MAG: metal-dependent hydrolase [Alphaproteobacteria bacterium ADurb.Bin438]|nr:MAG: metal-dependent hydrolase [Alphaproteobacteria bacterium ADurb.Bin438]
MMDTFKIKDIEIKYLSHSGFLITKGEHKILIDPYLSENPLAKIKPQDIKATDILLTHGHFDHVGDAIEIAKQNDCNITTVFELASWCERQGAKANGMPVGGKFKFPWGIIHLRQAMHASITSDGVSVGFPASILIDFGDVKIYHLGDTALINDFKLVGEIYKPDIALMPIGGKYTMDINEAVIATKWLNVSTVIPMHYDTFDVIKANPEEFKQKVEKETNAKCVILRF